MLSFIQYIAENLDPSRSDHILHHSLHWLGDNQDGNHVYLYHGSHIKHTDNIKKNGVIKPDPDTGLVSHALDPMTARGYAARSGAGGEKAAVKTNNIQSTPKSERVIHILKVPKSVVKTHMADMRGNSHTDKTRLTDKTRFENAKAQYGKGKSGEHPYRTAEIRISPETSAAWHKKYYVGHFSDK